MVFQLSQLPDCPEILKEFLVYLQTIRNKSPKTVYEYFLDLRLFFRFLKQKRGLVASDVPFDEILIGDITIEQLKTVTLSEVYDFLYFLLSERHACAATRCRKSASLRTFFSYLSVQRGLLDVNPISELEMPGKPKRLPKYLSLEECTRLLQAIEGKFAVRDYCIAVLFLNCGLRLSELCGINLSDIQEDTLRVVGKGNKERIVHLNDACTEAIREYLKVRPNNIAKDRQALFISRQGNRIRPITVQTNMQRYFDMSGLTEKGYSVHKLRHTAATLMYQYGGVDLRILKEILGHENIATTEIYTHISNEQLNQALQSNPLAEYTLKKQNAPLNKKES